MNYMFATMQTGANDTFCRAVNGVLPKARHGMRSLMVDTRIHKTVRVQHACANGVNQLCRAGLGVVYDQRSGKYIDQRDDVVRA